MNETERIKAAKQLLKDNGYRVARIAHPGWEKEAYRMNDEYVAFRLKPRKKNKNTRELS